MLTGRPVTPARHWSAMIIFPNLQERQPAETYSPAVNGSKVRRGEEKALCLLKTIGEKVSFPCHAAPVRRYHFQLKSHLLRSRNEIMLWISTWIYILGWLPVRLIYLKDWFFSFFFFFYKRKKKKLLVMEWEQWCMGEIWENIYQHPTAMRKLDDRMKRGKVPKFHHTWPPLSRNTGSFHHHPLGLRLSTVNYLLILQDLQLLLIYSFN